MLKEAQKDYNKTPRPQLDEGQIYEMEQLSAKSFVNKSLLEITTWKDGFFSLRVGTVTKIDHHTKKIHIQDELDSMITIDFFSITKVFIK
jgi:hypothetical protein